MSKLTRTKARELALQSLYRLEMSGERVISVMRDIQERFTEIPENELRYIEELLKGVTKHREEIDSSIDAVLERWKPERVNLIDRCILRIGVYEMVYCQDIPVAVAINEAVELARKYGDSGSPAFVNGILDAIRKCNTSGDESESS